MKLNIKEDDIKILEKIYEYASLNWNVVWSDSLEKGSQERMKEIIQELYELKPKDDRFWKTVFRTGLAWLNGNLD